MDTGLVTIQHGGLRYPRDLEGGVAAVGAVIDTYVLAPAAVDRSLGVIRLIVSMWPNAKYFTPNTSLRIYRLRYHIPLAHVRQALRVWTSAIDSPG